MQSRVVSDKPLIYHPPQLHIDNSLPRQTTPIEAQRSKYYFQYRLDRIGGSIKHSPRVCIGVCREDFLVNMDLSRQKNVWCLNLNSGDVYTDKRWRDYFNSEQI
jgi:hypothetical protein